MLISDEWMQYNYSCTIQEFLQMSFDDWVRHVYNSSVADLYERFRIMCKQGTPKTKEEFAMHMIGCIKDKYYKAVDMLHLQMMDLDFEDWLEVYHLPAERLKEVVQATGTVREQAEYMRWYIERYQQEQEAKKNMRLFYKQEELQI